MLYVVLPKHNNLLMKKLLVVYFLFFGSSLVWLSKACLLLLETNLPNPLRVLWIKIFRKSLEAELMAIQIGSD